VPESLLPQDTYANRRGLGNLCRVGAYRCPSPGRRLLPHGDRAFGLSRLRRGRSCATSRSGDWRGLVPALARHGSRAAGGKSKRRPMRSPRPG